MNNHSKSHVCMWKSKFSYLQLSLEEETSSSSQFSSYQWSQLKSLRQKVHLPWCGTLLLTMYVVVVRKDRERCLIKHYFC